MRKEGTAYEAAAACSKPVNLYPSDQADRGKTIVFSPQKQEGGDSAGEAKLAAVVV